jgi:hypothetical protein
MKNRFEQVTIDKTTVVEKEGLEICAFIAGVNSGMFGLPFCIQVRAWTSFLWFKKFFFVQAKLNLEELKRLQNEFQKAITYLEATEEERRKL